MKRNSSVISSIFILCILAFGFSLIITQSCSKDEIVKSSKNEIPGNIISFDSSKELSAALDKVLSMNMEELKIYEESKGYMSFGRKCEELYSSINFEKYQSLNELKAYVESNSEYLKIVEDEEGGLVLETAISGSPYRYFCNSDRLFQIKDEVYKVFDDGMIATNAKNIEKLKSLKNINVPLSGVDKDLRVMSGFKKSLISESKLKDAGYNCGTGSTARATDGRDRTLLEISIGYVDTYDINGAPMTIYQNRVLVRPYKRTLGIWYWCSRTLSCDIKVAVDVNTTSGWQRGYFYKNEPGNHDSKLEYVISGGVVSIGSWQRYDMHYGGFDCWAKSPSTGKAVLQCNTNLF